MAVPTHIGVILDGNRRFAKQLMQVPWMGHKWGLEKSREVLQWACEAGIRYITAYTLSLENMKTRPEEELDFILRHLADEADNIFTNMSHVVHRFNVRVRFIGRLRELPDSLQEKFRKVEEKTAHYAGHVLNVAVAYGGQQEITDAVRKIMEEGMKGILKPSDMNEEILKEHLYTNGQPYPDMIFRTGGEKRLSNFMPFQSAYSELIFTDRKWPELTKEDFENALKEFSERKRRYGA
ncbi:MAG: di-trans,poly-cis-decaprenylcistransferase [Candidatus Aenigmarchaeota archaeon]|nr:di-trans,poly-cis-decaprenylcistransferase [Candidatus Aenigmarchaeota archaeon]